MVYATSVTYLCKYARRSRLCISEQRIVSPGVHPAVSNQLLVQRIATGTSRYYGAKKPVRSAKPICEYVG